MDKKIRRAWLKEIVFSTIAILYFSILPAQNFTDSDVEILKEAIATSGYENSDTVQWVDNASNFYLLDEMAKYARVDGKPVNTCFEYYRKSAVLQKLLLPEEIANYAAQREYEPNLTWLSSTVVKKDLGKYFAPKPDSKQRVRISKPIYSRDRLIALATISQKSTFSILIFQKINQKWTKIDSVCQEGS